jgi:polyribonucleotide nucleotidyltransferase
VTPPEFDEAYFKSLESKIGARLADALDTAKHPKSESYELVRVLEKELLAALPEDDAAGKPKVKKYYEILRERIFRNQVIDHKRRPDGRAFRPDSRDLDRSRHFAARARQRSLHPR